MDQATVGLNLACGCEYRDDMINIDNKQMYGGNMIVDMEADIFDLQWEPGAVHTILVNHFIQYVVPQKMYELLQRWMTWLTPGGSIWIEAGNILAVAKNILEAKTIGDLHGKDAIMQLYGIDDNIWNKWAWCPESLTPILQQAGYVNIESHPGRFHQNPHRDFLMVAYKPNEYCNIQDICEGPSEKSATGQP